MQLSEIKTRGWWAIEDDPITPNEITDVEMGTLINQAVANLADVLNINKNATITLTANVGTLPADFLTPVRVEDSTGRYIDQIDDINDKDGYLKCWMISNATAFTVYPVATTVASVTMYYKGYPALITLATASPTDIPAEFHHYIADIWVKAHYALKKNFLDEYSGLMQLWDGVRNDIAYACKNRRGATIIETIRQVY
jgi:hypothetical protein